MKKKICIALSIMIISLAGAAWAESSEEPACPHDWEETSLHISAPTDYAVTIWDAEHHSVRPCISREVCSLCGAVQAEWSNGGWLAAHAFSAVDWACSEDGTRVSMHWQCRDCGYERVDTAPTAQVQQGRAGSCLLGGVCQAHNGLPNGDGLLVQASSATPVRYDLAYTGEDNSYHLVQWLYCLTCGRPYMRTLDTAVGAPKAEWGVQEVTQPEDYLAEDVLLPYQVIDALRGEP